MNKKRLPSAVDYSHINEAKRYERMTSARIAVAHANQFIASHPQAVATPIITELRLSLLDLMSEISLLTATRKP